jgi:hypothetical protein
MIHNNLILSENINESDTIISVVSTTGVWSSGYLIIDSEMIKYTNITGNKFISCIRGVNGTSPSVHHFGDKIETLLITPLYYHTISVEDVNQNELNLEWIRLLN